MTTPLEELKIRARLLCKALDQNDAAARQRAAAVAKAQRWAPASSWSLGQCLNLVAAEAGFAQWEHARVVLGGTAAAGEDMGRFWYDKGCAHLLNHWYARYDEALASLQLRGQRYLLPYERQFIVADAPFVMALGMDATAPAWAALGRDLVAGYGTPAWLALVGARLDATRPGGAV